MLPLGKKLGPKISGNPPQIGWQGGGGGITPSSFLFHCLLLHARHAASEGYHVVVTCSEDTDIFNMSLAFQELPCFKSVA